MMHEQHTFPEASRMARHVIQTNDRFIANINKMEKRGVHEKEMVSDAGQDKRPEGRKKEVR